MRANLTIVASLRFRLKEICVGICTSGKASVHLLFIFSVIEAAYKLTFFAFPEPTLLRTIDQAGTCRIC